MKKIYTMLMMAMMALAFTSCEDAKIADTLEGTWKGNMYISSMYDGRVYDIAYTEITFLQDPYEYASGSGYWVDYYDYNTPWGEYIANNISWEVRNKVIYVYFREDGNSLRISNYTLNRDWFTGTIYDGRNTVDFELRHTSRPRYNGYRWGYYGDWDYYGYYARTRSEAEAANPTKDIAAPVRFVNPELKKDRAL